MFVKHPVLNLRNSQSKREYRHIFLKNTTKYNHQQSINIGGLPIGSKEGETQEAKKNQSR